MKRLRTCVECGVVLTDARASVARKCERCLNTGDAAICPRCQINPLTHPQEIKEQCCIVCYFGDLHEENPPLPPSDFYTLDMFEQDRLTSRQQTEMAGEA